MAKYIVVVTSSNFVRQGQLSSKVAETFYIPIRNGKESSFELEIMSGFDFRHSDMCRDYILKEDLIG